MINTIVFDWHGVFDWATFQGFVQTLIEDTGLSFEDLKAAPYWSDSDLKFAEGKITQEEFWKPLRVFGELNFEKAHQYATTIAWNNELIRLLPSLQDRYALYILSDCSHEKKTIIDKEMDYAPFKKTYFSCDYGMTKREDRFFQLFLRETGLDPRNCVFVDDSQRNCDRAEKLGFKTIVYHHSTDIIRALEDLREG